MSVKYVRMYRISMIMFMILFTTNGVDIFIYDGIIDGIDYMFNFVEHVGYLRIYVLIQDYLFFRFLVEYFLTRESSTDKE